MADRLRTVQGFVSDVRTEMQKVTWPDWPQLKNSTFVIVVFVAVLALVIFVMDFVSRRLLELLSSIFGG
ncbi:MAG TPA: preprotein translocase subunit SecE [Longimicrobiaceae bacterium]